MRYIIDSSAWIDYLEGGQLGEKVRKLILGDNEILSLNLIVAEVISYIKRKESNAELAYNAITTNSKIIEISPDVAKRAGLFHAEIRKKVKNFGLVDAVILMAARDKGAKILTGDAHFKNFKEAVFG
ncbi:MAG: PIN domain-containing protein [Nanoarchaeota archaeon]|nr:PIN domain-containing protein [Nanoarchaeota archaeon]MBU1103715.1 PIN domain-containing protein [Nanoarchaeota archaeon]